MRRMGARIGVVVLTPAALLGGCAIYAPAPLPDRPDLRQSVTQLTVAADRLPLRQIGISPV